MFASCLPYSCIVWILYASSTAGAEVLCKAVSSDTAQITGAEQVLHGCFSTQLYIARLQITDISLLLSVMQPVIVTKPTSLHALVLYNASDVLTFLHPTGLLLFLALALVFATLFAFACCNWLVCLQSNVDKDV